MRADPPFVGLVRKLAPQPIKRWYHALRQHTAPVPPLAQLFSDIYASGHWGSQIDRIRQPFYSGYGSHEAWAREPFLAAMRGFLSGFAEKPSFVDIGSGDFSIGAELRPLCSSYVSLDVVPALIAYNRAAFANRDVSFLVHDITKRPPPPADVAMVRHVFQHLSNRHIQRALDYLAGRFRYLIVSEDIPREPNIVPNQDEPPSGIARRSGVAIHAQPFRFAFAERRTLVRIEAPDGRLLVTDVYLLPVKQSGRETPAAFLNPMRET